MGGRGKMACAPAPAATHKVRRQGSGLGGHGQVGVASKQMAACRRPPLCPCGTTPSDMRIPDPLPRPTAGLHY